MYILVYSEVLKQYFVVPHKWVLDLKVSRHMNRSMNHNQGHLIYFTNVPDSIKHRKIDEVFPPNFHAPFAFHLMRRTNMECVFIGCLIEAYGE